MATSYPGSVDNFTNPTASDLLNSATVPHATQHANANDAIEAIEGELGTTPSGSYATVAARFAGIEGSSSYTSAFASKFPRPSAERLLGEAVWWVDAAHSSASGQAITNLGWGGAALNAQAGSTTGADSNDPKYLDWDGTNYAYLPGVAGNYLSVPDEAALDITGDIDIRCKVALDDWTPAARSPLVSRFQAAPLSYELVLNTAGTVELRWNNGSANVARTSTQATGLTDGSIKWVRATLDVDNGASGHDVKFWLSDDGVAWTQLGSTVTTAGTTAVQAGDNNVWLGADGEYGDIATGKFHRAQVLSGIGGTVVLDVDTSAISSGSATSFTARTGQTVSIARSSSGRKAVAVTHPCLLLGSDDYLEVADSDLLDFGATDSFTVLAVARSWDVTNQMMVVCKRSSGGGAGWNLETGSGVAKTLIFDGSEFPSDTKAVTAGTLSVMAGVRNVSSDNITTWVNGAGSSSADSTTGSFANAQPLRVGSWSNAATAAMEGEFTAAAVWRRALTSDEISSLTTYFQQRAI